MAHEIIYKIDLSEPHSDLELNKLSKMNDMANMIWEIQNNLIFNRDDSMVTAQDVFVRLIEMMEERNLVAHELTF